MVVDMSGYHRLLYDDGFIWFSRQRSKNELYDAMNSAVIYCLMNDIPYIYFIQDDQQFVWQDKDMIARYEALFEDEKNALTIHTSIPRRFQFDLSPPNLDMKWKQENDTRYYLYNMMYSDRSVLRVNMFKKTGLFPKDVCTHDFYNSKGKYIAQSGERWMRKRVDTLYPEAKCIALRDGNLVMVPDTCVIRGAFRYGDHEPPLEKYYISPLKEEKMRLLKSDKQIVFEDEIIEANMKNTKIDASIKKRISQDVYGYPNDLSFTFPFVPKGALRSPRFTISNPSKKEGEYLISRQKVVRQPIL